MKWEHTIKGGLPVGGGDDHPVVNLNWQDAAAFCEWLSKKEGIDYRLPTDQEWSCAVGIGEREPKDATPEALTMEFPGEYPWGREWPPPKGAGNFADAAYHEKFPNEKSIEGYSDGFPTTSPVRSFPPNKLGIYDLVGNVWQWCRTGITPATNSGCCAADLSTVMSPPNFSPAGGSACRRKPVSSIMASVVWRRRCRKPPLKILLRKAAAVSPGWAQGGISF